MVDKAVFEKVKKLQEKTGLSLHVCKNALDQSERDLDKAIALLKRNGFIHFLSKKEILDRCIRLADEWALDFLESTLETGELLTYHAAGRIRVIQDNFFSWYIVGIPGRCPYLLFKKDLEFFSEHESSEFSQELRELYDQAVERFLPNYISGKQL